MAHYAYLDSNNLVVAVVVGKDETDLIDGLDTETYYALGTEYTVKRTSYNSNIRGTFAAVGYSYNADEDIFITPQPYPSWIRSGSLWNAPIEKPNDEKIYLWDEQLGDWVEALAK
jgi:hypothetical protein